MPENRPKQLKEFNLGWHTLRHSRVYPERGGATLLLEAGYNIRTVRKLLEYTDGSTAMIYTHVLARPGLSVKTPADI
jgi:site-specific recombinase XerD